MGKINLTAVTIAGGIIPKDQALLALKIKELRQLPPLSIMNKQLEAFLPGGALERVLEKWRLSMRTMPSDFAFVDITEEIVELEALLTKKEGGE